MSVQRSQEAVCLDSAQRRFFWFDHFLGDQLKDEWSSTGEAGGSADVVDLQMGGVVRLTTGATTDDFYRIDWNDIRSLHVSKRVSMEVRAKANQSTFINLYLRLHYTGDTCIDFHYTAGPNWSIRCINGGAATIFDSGIALDTDYHIFRIECHLHGGNHVHFYIDDVEMDNSPITTNIPDDAGDYLEPFLYIKTTENLAKSMDIDYVVVRQDR